MAGEPILIVDDNPANLKVARVTLEAEGYQIRVATDGNEALAVLRDFRPRLILMDLQLPGIDGLELTRRLKADRATGDIRIVAVTAYAMKGDEEKALAAGCDGYLTKPLDPLQLPAVVASHLERAERPAAIPSPPRSPSPPTMTSSTSSSPGRNPQAGALVLVIEDNPITRKMIRVALETRDFVVAEADSGAAAIARIVERAPALVLQDLVLPDIDGLELVLRLRERLGMGVPILCLTGFLSRLDEIQAIKGGFSAVMLKPVDPIELCEAVATHLGRGRGRPAPDDGHLVLVVDDDPLQRKLAQFYLANAGFRVRLAEDGPSALKEAAAMRPHVIVSDVLMPTMDGFQLCLLARRSPALASVPIVLVSSHYIEDADRRLALKVGARALVQRTPEWDAVIAAANDALQMTPAAAAPIAVGDLDTGEHARRILWQLERQASQSSSLGRRCTVQAAQLAVLAGTAEALAKNQRLDGVLGDVLAACLDMAGISKGALYLADARGRLVLQECIGFADADRGGLDRCFGQDALIGDVLAVGKVIAVPSQAIPTDAAAALLAELGVPGALIVPVVWASEVKGALLLGVRSNEMSGDEAIAFARVLGLQMAQAIGLAQTFHRLTMAEQRYRTLMESAHDAVCVLTPDEIVVEVNRRWEELIGLPRDQIVGRPLGAFAVPDVENGAAARAKEAAPGGPAWTQAVRVRKADGSVALLEISKVSLEISGERIVFAIGRDVTEQTWARAQLMTSDRMASVGLLASGVAHEINNPLAAVMANLELATAEVEKLSRRGVEGGDLIEELKDAREAADRVRQVARDLKVFSRAEDDDLGEVDLRRVLESSVRMAWNEIRHRARLVKCFDPVPPITGNESRMGQAFLNLIVNAAQAIQEGNAESNDIRLTLSRDADDVVVEIADTGAGIAPEVQARLFTPFFTTKPAGVGSGLGLSISRRIITAAGGTITVDSQVGKGTTFRVRLPAAEARVAPPQSVRSSAPPSTARGRILVIDDEPMVLRALDRILAAEHEVIALGKARQALDRIHGGERFDLILCDLMMPEMSGIDFHAALIAAAPEQARRIVFLTGGAFTSRGRAFLEGVGNLRIEKPFEAQRLRALVSDQLSGATPDV